MAILVISTIRSCKSQETEPAAGGFSYKLRTNFINAGFFEITLAAENSYKVQTWRCRRLMRKHRLLKSVGTAPSKLQNRCICYKKKRCSWDGKKQSNVTANGKRKKWEEVLMDLQCVGASHTSCIAQSSRTEWFNKIFGKFPACVISSFLVLAFYIW